MKVKYPDASFDNNNELCTGVETMGFVPIWYGFFIGNIEDKFDELISILNKSKDDNIIKAVHDIQSAKTLVMQSLRNQ